MRRQGTGTLFQRSSDGRWCVRWYEYGPSGVRRRREKSSKDRATAQRFLEEKFGATTQRARLPHRSKQSPEVRSHMRELWAASNGLCVYCRTELNQFNAVADHIHPVALGGTDEPANLQLICWQCNNEKGTRLDYRYQGEPRPFQPMPVRAAEWERFEAMHRG